MPLVLDVPLDAALGDLPPDALVCVLTQRARPRQRRNGHPRCRRGRRRRSSSSATPASTSTTARWCRSTVGSLWHLPISVGATVPDDPRGPARPGAAPARRRRGGHDPAATSSTWPRQRRQRLGHGQRGVGPQEEVRDACDDVVRVPDLRARRVAQPRDGRDRVSLRVCRGAPRRSADRTGRARSPRGYPSEHDHRRR